MDRLEVGDQLQWPDRMTMVEGIATGDDLVYFTSDGCDERHSDVEEGVSA